MIVDERIRQEIRDIEARLDGIRGYL